MSLLTAGRYCSTATHLPQGPPVPLKAVVGPAYLEGLRLAAKFTRHLSDEHDARPPTASPLCDGLVDIEPTAHSDATQTQTQDSHSVGINPIAHCRQTHYVGQCGFRLRVHACRGHGRCELAMWLLTGTQRGTWPQGIQGRQALLVWSSLGGSKPHLTCWACKPMTHVITPVP